MKKIIYYLSFILLLFLISIIPASAKEIQMCERSENDLHVRDSMIKNNTSNILATPCVDAKLKVYDFGDLLTDSEEDMLYDEAQKFIENTNYDIAIVTISENSKGSAREYADDFYDYNEFGINETRDGLLLLIDMDTREIYISTTGYAIKMYDDARLGIYEEFYGTDSVLDYGFDYVTKKEYYNAFSSMITRLTEFYNLGYPSSNQNMEISSTGEPIIIHYISYPFVGTISAIIAMIIGIIFYNISRLKIKVGSTTSYMQSSNITTRTDFLVNSVVTHTLRHTDSGSSSGGSGGGSSYHSSSSGSFHGGGGRGF